MTSKGKSIFSVVTSIVLAMILCFSLAIPALALDYTTGTDSTDPAQAAITKRLRMPVNTTTPDATFTFKFDAVGLDDGTDPTGMPALPDRTVTFTSGQMATFTDGGDIYVVDETLNILDGITPSFWTLGEHIYKYEVYEVPSGIVLTGAPNEGDYYSTARYEIEIWVEPDPANNGDLFAKYICAKIINDGLTTLPDEYYPSTEADGAKIDPTPGGPKQDSGAPTIADDFSQLIFTNRYWASDGGGTADPNMTSLEITKTVTGDGAEKDKYFEFTVTATQPDAIVDSNGDPITQTYMAYIIDTNGTAGTPLADYTNNYSGAGLDANGYITVNSGEPLTVKLKYGQTLAFIDLPAGAVIEAAESADPDYIPSYHRTFAIEAGNNTGVSKEYKATAANTPWGFPDMTNDPGPQYLEAAANFNIATFNNYRIGATPTGISVDDLPYIALIAVGLIVIAGFVTYKLRKGMKNDAA